jgi:hypothetical protein
MATRMQQRRGTAQQWTDADPRLESGEIGFETDTNQFKIGDGVNVWSDLSYFKNLEDLGGSFEDYALANAIGIANGIASLDATGNVPLAQLANLIDGAPELLNTINELAAAIDDNATFANTVLTSVDAAQQAAQGFATDAVVAHAELTSNVHGIANTYALATREYADNAISVSAALLEGQIETHASITSNIHGIANTLALATTTYVDDQASYAQGNAEATASSALSTHESDYTSVHGIANTLALVTNTTLNDALDLKADLAGPTFTGNTVVSTLIVTDSLLGVSGSSIGLGNVEDTADLDKPVSTATQTALDLKAPLAAPSFTGEANFESNVTIEGNLTVEGTTTTVNTSEVQINDPLFYLAANQYDTNTRDIGITGAYGTTGGDEEDHLHTGLVKDVTDGKWKLFSNAPHPVNNLVDFTSADYDTLKVGPLEATTVTPSSGIVFSDGTQTKEGVVSRTPIIQKTASYTLSALTERDSMIEVASGSATTITIPANSAVAFPVGTSIDILQTSTGQVTIAGAGGVTVNATPGLKLRTQWSGATLFKRATDTWVVYGDLSA